MGLGHLSQNTLTGNIPSAVKADFTRNYNKGNHPIPFMSSNEKVSKIAAAGPRPDFEDVVEEDVVPEEEDEEEGKEDDIAVDKLIKAKTSGSSAKASGSKGKGKASKSKSK